MDDNIIYIEPVAPHQQREGWVGEGRPVWASGPRLRNIRVEVGWRGNWPPPSTCTLDEACANVGDANARLLRVGVSPIPQRHCDKCGLPIRAGQPVHRPYTTDLLYHASCAGVRSDYLAMPTGDEAEFRSPAPEAQQAARECPRRPKREER